MNGRHLLDTNILVELFGRNQEVQDRLRQAGEVLVPTTVLGELYFGARKSRRPDERLAEVEEFAAANGVAGCDQDTPRHYGAIKDALRRVGRMIPENDIWIAAIALQHNLTLVTRDAHFGAVPGLHVEEW